MTLNPPHKPTTEEAVKRLIYASAPEQQQKFDEIWKEFSPQIEFVEDREGFSLEAGAFGLILFNHKSMAQIWLLGFAAQNAYNAFLPYLCLSQMLKLPITSDDFVHEETKQDISKARYLLDRTIELYKIDSIENFPWPKDVPRPIDGKPSDVNGSMVFDLLCMGGAYCFLHELKHVMFKQSNECIHSHDEEMLCDAFAREFLLKHVAKYSHTSGTSLELVKTKRAMSIGLVSLLLFTLTPNKQWFGTDSHPSIRNRILALTDYLELPESSYFWGYLTCILILVMAHNNISFSYPAITSQRKFCEFLLGKLAEQIT